MEEQHIPAPETVTTQPSFENCIKLCWTARDTCQTTMSQHCLPKGGEHAAGRHIEMMIDCIQICQVAADYMTRSSPMHAAITSACAVICDTTADSCETFTVDKEMLHCAEVCRACAHACRTTGQDTTPPLVKEDADAEPPPLGDVFKAA